jgi:MFS family permease
MPQPAFVERRPVAVAVIILALCFLTNLVGRGLVETYPIFMLPLEREFGWSRTLASGIYSAAFLVTGTVGPLIGWLFDRFGPARLYALGLAVLSLAALAASQAAALWQFYATVGVLFGLGMACIGTVPMASLLSRWFRRRLNTALALAYASGGLGILVMAPTAQALLDGVGWRQAYLLLGVGIACLLPVALALGLLRAGDGHPVLRPPAPAGSGPMQRGGQGVTLPQALRMGAFWGLGWTFCFTGIGMYTVMLQAPAFLVETGYTPQTAASAFGLIGLLAPIGMVLFGGLADRFGRRRMVLVSYALTIAGIACLVPLLAGRNDLALAGFVGCFGLSFGSRGPAISTIAAGIFRGPWMGRIYGFITIGMGLGGGLGSAFGGLAHDLTDGYAAGIGCAMLFVACGSLPFFAVRAIARS